MVRGACLILVVALSACGARSQLLGETEEEPTTTTSSSSSGSGGGTVAPPDPCLPVAAGEAAPLLSFTDRHAVAPSVALSPGGSRLFLQAFASGGTSPLHSDIQLAELAVGPAWPDVTIENGPATFGLDAHGWGVLAPSPPGRDEMILGWHGDPGGVGRPLLRRLDLATNQGMPPSDVTEDAEAVLDIAPGADGYAVAWRQTFGDESWAPAVRRFDLDAAPTSTPLALTSPREYPGRSVALTWTGSTYLAAIAFDTCLPDEAELCREHAVVVDDLGAELGSAKIVATFPLRPDHAARRPYLASHGGRTYLAWAESLPDGEPATVRLTELAADGTPIGTPLDVAADLPLLSRPTMIAGDGGVTIAWPETANHALPEHVVGHDALVITQLDADLEVLAARVSVPIPRFETYGPSYGVALAEPRSLFFVIGARLPSGYDGVFGARFDCR